MAAVIAIRREDKNRWERRVPLAPRHVSELISKHGLEVLVQPSQIRVFRDDEYLQSGARVDEDIDRANLIFAVKEIPTALLRPNKTYVFFSHVLKGQKKNMPLLKRLLELGCTLIDYELVTDEKHRRLIFFGRFAGLAGMIEALWALGQRLQAEGLPTPFARITHAYLYLDLQQAEQAVAAAGAEITQHGLPKEVTPFICGFAGNGNVSQGAQQIFNHLPLTDLKPEKLESFMQAGRFDAQRAYKVVFTEQHMVEAIKAGAEFALPDYYEHPEKYRSVFSRYLPHLTMLINGIFWSEKYPRLVTKEDARRLIAAPTPPRLRVIGDISCDVNGSIEFTEKITEPDQPVFTYDPVTNSIAGGYEGRGIVVEAVDNLPCEFPRDASLHFGDMLFNFVAAMAACDFNKPLEKSDLPPAIRRAVIAYRGELTPPFRYLEKSIAGGEEGAR